MRPFPSLAPLALVVLAGCAAPTPSNVPSPATAGGDAYRTAELAAPTPITAAEYARRRAALARELADGVLFVPGAPAPLQDYLPFFQEPNFRYLTGLTEPDAALVIDARDGRTTEYLFVPPRNPEREVWEGARLGPERAAELTGMRAATADRLVPLLDSLLSGGGRLYTTETVADSGDPLAVRSPTQQAVARIATRQPDVRVVSAAPEIRRLRAEKSPAELDRIRRAVEITVLAHRAAMRTLEPGMNEFELQALIEYTFRRYGAERPAFATIVGSGPNATTLHYNADDRFIDDGAVVVMDIGAAYAGYAADVTRTVPVSGRFSDDQRAIYEIVLAAQKAAERRARPGATWPQLNAAAREELASGLARLGLIEAPDATYDCGTANTRRDCSQYSLFYLHGLGHGIGLDVHDPDVADYEPFRPGSAFTIEPGLYVRADALEYLPETERNRAMIEQLRPAVERYRNIGVRIEDDFMVTDAGVERISVGAPREIDEIEALMRLPPAAGDPRRGEIVEWYRAVGGR